jgi:hypothetical protein
VVGTEDLQVKKVTGQITALSQPGRSSKPVGTGELIECRQTPSRDLDHLHQRDRGHSQKINIASLRDSFTRTVSQIIRTPQPLENTDPVSRAALADSSIGIWTS